MQKKAAYIIAGTVFVSVLVISILGKHENKGNPPKETTSLAETTQEITTREIQQEDNNTEEIIIASGGSKQATETDSDEINEMIEEGKAFHKEKTEIYENVTFENMDIFTERSCVIDQLYESLKNYLYKAKDGREMTECVFDPGVTGEGSIRHAVLHFSDGTTREISVLWQYYQYFITDYEEIDPDYSGAET